MNANKIEENAIKLRDGLERYWSTTNSDPRHASRTDIKVSVDRWAADQVMREGSSEQSAEWSLVREVIRWLALDIDDVTMELEDAISLFDFRRRTLDNRRE